MLLIFSINCLVPFSCHVNLLMNFSLWFCRMMSTSLFTRWLVSLGNLYLFATFFCFLQFCWSTFFKNCLFSSDFIPQLLFVLPTKMNKKQIFCYQNSKFLKIWFLFMVFTKGQKSDQGKFVRKFIGIIITIAFI